MAAQAAIHASLCRFSTSVSWMPASPGMTFVGHYLSDTGHYWLGQPRQKPEQIRYGRWTPVEMNLRLG
jgi:hypothetical protein